MITSSKIEQRAEARAQVAEPLEEPVGGRGHDPMFAATGSTITHATSSPRSAKIAPTASRSL